MEKEIELELPRGEKPKEGKTEMAEKTVELMSGSPLEMKLEEVLGKVTAMESAMTKRQHCLMEVCLMEKQEKDKTGQSPMPLGMILDHAREDMTKSVVALQQKYGLPASLLDVILTGVLSEVREMKCMEYRQLKEGEQNGKCNNLSE